MSAPDVSVTRICRLLIESYDGTYIQIVREEEAQPRLKVKRVGVPQENKETTSYQEVRKAAWQG